MTDFPGEGYLSRYNDIVRKLLGAKSGEPLHEAAAELVFAVILENDRLEHWLPAGTRAWWVLTTLAASVGNFSTVMVSVPTSGKILSTVSAILNIGAAPINIARVSLPGGLGTVAVQHRDARAKGVPQTFLSTRQGAQLAGSASMQLPGAAGAVVPTFAPREGVSVEAPAQSSGVLAMEPLANNTAITVGLFGYERQVEDAELTQVA